MAVSWKFPPSLRDSKNGEKDPIPIQSTRLTAKRAQRFASPIQFGRLLGEAKAENIFSPARAIKCRSCNSPHPGGLQQIARFNTGIVPLDFARIGQHIVGP